MLLSKISSVFRVVEIHALACLNSLSLYISSVFSYTLPPIPAIHLLTLCNDYIDNKGSSNVCL